MIEPQPYPAAAAQSPVGDQPDLKLDAEFPGQHGHQVRLARGDPELAAADAKAGASCGLKLVLCPCDGP
ncbi:MAG: hypothetical protein KGJ49_11240 [Alphaproteobacteria bacterium]|nr:hypothetical protein [Alphaproteobacteria bacterium]